MFVDVNLLGERKWVKIIIDLFIAKKRAKFGMKWCLNKRKTLATAAPPLRLLPAAVHIELLPLQRPIAK